MERFLNLAAIQNTSLNETPFPYLVISNFIKPDFLQSLVMSFPSIKNRGSIPLSAVSPQSLFQEFIKELEGPTLKQVIAHKFNMDLKDKPTLLTLRGMTHAKDGAIHTDSKTKLITLLLYLNSTWDDEGGKLRLLKNSHSLSDYVEEVSPLAGSCVIFKVTPNCWHGHRPFIGKRQSLQLNYLTSDTALTKHLNHHRFSAWLKEKLPWVFRTRDRNY